jgi:hypothetical protein
VVSTPHYHQETDHPDKKFDKDIQELNSTMDEKNLWQQITHLSQELTEHSPK